MQFQISFNPKHRDVATYSSLCSLQQTNLQKQSPSILEVAQISRLTRGRIHSIDALREPITDQLVGHQLQEGAVPAEKPPLLAYQIIRRKEALSSLCAGTHPDSFVHSSTQHPPRCRSHSTFYMPSAGQN